MSIICLFQGHHFTADRGGDHDGCCIKEMRCSRCGKIESELTNQEHDFGPRELTGYSCNHSTSDLAADHIDYRETTRTCKNCGYIETERQPVSREDYGTETLESIPRQEICSAYRLCKGCQKKIQVFFDSHSYGPPQPLEECHSVQICQNCGFEWHQWHHVYSSSTYEKGTNTVYCQVVHRCTKCGHVEVQTNRNSSLNMHRFGEWEAKENSPCLFTRACSRCGFTENKEEHEFEKLVGYDVMKEGVQSDYFGGVVDILEFTYQCKRCGKTEKRYDGQ